MLVLNHNNEIPELTKQVAQTAFPNGNVIMKIRDELGAVYEDEIFAKLYPALGQPGISPGQLALVTVFQYLENLTDRQAAEAVRGRIDWKYALGLALTDAGFDYSVLSEFRQRLLTGGAEITLLDQILIRCEAKGLLKGKHKQRTDSTHILAAIRTMNRLEVVGETMRRALDTLAQVAPDWLKTHLKPEWGSRYQRRVDNYRLPKGQKERQTLAEAIGQDGFVLLAAVYEPTAPEHLRALPAIQTLRCIWVQQYYCEGADVQWRTKKNKGLPPSSQMIASPDEQDARYAAKREMTWTGYKVHLTETCDDEHPRIITHVDTTPATTYDVHLTATIQADLTANNMAPDQHLVDAGYLEADLLYNSHQKGIDLIGPMPADNTWQARTEGAFNHHHFQIDWIKKQATCPGGKTSSYHKEGTTRRGTPNIHFTFGAKNCNGCSLRSRCTRAKLGGRTLTLYPQPVYQTLLAARKRQKTEAFKTLYKARAGIEGTISQAVNAFNIRQARYRGLARTHLQNIATAAAINLTRIANWLMGNTPEATRISPFAALVAQI